MNKETVFCLSVSADVRGANVLRWLLSYLLSSLSCPDSLQLSAMQELPVRLWGYWSSTNVKKNWEQVGARYVLVPGALRSIGGNTHPGVKIEMVGLVKEPETDRGWAIIPQRECWVRFFPVRSAGGEWKMETMYPFWGLLSTQVEADGAGFVLNLSSVGTNHYGGKSSAHDLLEGLSNQVKKEMIVLCR